MGNKEGRPHTEADTLSYEKEVIETKQHGHRKRRHRSKKHDEELTTPSYYVPKESQRHVDINFPFRWLEDVRPLLSNEAYLSSLSKETHFSPREIYLLGKETFTYTLNAVRVEESGEKEFILNASKFSSGLSDHLLGRVFRWWDRDGDGFLSFADRVKSLSETYRGSLEEQLSSAFRFFDTNRDGYVSRLEVLEVVREVNEHSEFLPSVSLERIDSLFCYRFGERNRVEQLNLQEFLRRAKEEKELVSSLIDWFGLRDFIFGERMAPLDRSISDPTLFFKRGYLLKSKKGSNWKKRWIVVRGGTMEIFDSSEDEERKKPNRKITLSSETSIYKVEDVKWKLEHENYSCFFKAATFYERKDWMDVLFAHSSLSAVYRFSSFAPPRDGNFAKWFHGGRQAFSDIADAIEQAKEEVFITDWFLFPYLYLKRGNDIPRGVNPNMFRLDGLLARKAAQGLRIFIILWKETKVVYPLNSAGTKELLEALHPNIFVLTHPPSFPVSWSHHQKIVVVDQNIAYLGGIDLTVGRWEDENYSLTDDCYLSLKWPGKDFCNAGIVPIKHISQPFIDDIDRSLYPRMPWQDIHAKIVGPSAKDVALNFIQRWNHHKTMNYPHLFMRHTQSLQNLGSAPNQNHCCCQILRSISPWSGGNLVESSINEAYLALIPLAKYFIYIENQYFISSLAGGGVKNKVAQALLERLRRAIKEKAIFRVIIILPNNPDGTVSEDAAVRFIMKFQFDTIDRGKNSLFGILSAEFPGVNLEQYLSFYCLRNYGFIGNKAVTEQIYVHSKLIIVDDCIALIGSANINDRSLLGNRDSEIAAIIEDNEGVEITMNGKPFRAKRFAHELRMRLWQVYLGLKDAELELIRDPVAPNVFNNIWRKRARENTRNFVKVFPFVPNDWVMELKEFREVKKRLTEIHKLSDELEQKAEKWRRVEIEEGKSTESLFEEKELMQYIKSKAVEILHMLQKGESRSRALDSAKQMFLTKPSTTSTTDPENNELEEKEALFTGKFVELLQATKTPQEMGNLFRSTTKAILSNIQGFLVIYPRKFLLSETLSPSLSDLKEKIASDKVFQ